MRPIFLFGLAILTGVFALANGHEIFFRLAYLILLVIVGSWLWTRYCLSGTEVDFSGSTTQATVGQRAWANLTAFNHSRIPKLWFEVDTKTQLPTPWPPHVVHLQPGRSRNWRINFECEQRGRFLLGPTEVRSGDPFGLFQKTAILGQTHSLLVYPATVPLTHFFLPPADLPGEGRRRRRTHFVTPNAASIREYVYADSFNRIHWRSTARTGKLMVKEFELDPASETWVILDLDQSVQSGEGQQSTEEYGVTIAASVVKHYLDANRPIGFMSYGRQPVTHRPERGGQQFVKIMESLAVARADGQVSIAELLAGEMRRFGRFTTLLIVTSSTQEDWVHQTQHLIRRGARIATVLIEPATFGGAQDAILAVSALLATRVPTYIVKKGASIQEALTSVQEASEAASS